MQRTESQWPMYVSLKKIEKQVGRWISESWELDQVLPATQPAPAGAKMVVLELHKDERGSYRINLDMDNAMLYVVCDELEDGTWVPAAISADQNVAAGCLEGDTPVLHMPMPQAVACWMEAFITRHGEVEICAHRRKHVNRRKNEGPSSNHNHGQVN
ncbi:DUF3305 domain-containing protein [Shewanella colwelliana]|uniref:DUF3305 domain-containing protein n=1 Tax=Shewanella colwelliana TaxID=23 RepID=A0A1E5IVS2_SHECO|nr:DUF3305 domain-containing protein [Shewanella colwelliana]MCZ4338388.1 DUF3305 domain-containing protein [Shewanella colwelliana]MDX1281386.1 DUF3305 domain-containing protein [Shewanella colwelliana]OEG74023.1 hypothetical protein BEL05_20220 [Shewanella colwelliana]GIU17212.1 hypothetical protein TUM4644_02210 [Shewanella colwelliana]GIU39272.1 hypothetical protein TUM3794_13680 [Shewanella colwelliana]